MPQGELRRLIDKTHFSMAQQDVRYYLNGMLLETDGKSLRAVATDGHRLALCETELGKAKSTQQVIVPRKGVLELQRMLAPEGPSSSQIGTNHVRDQLGEIRFTSKLIDGVSRSTTASSPPTPPHRGGGPGSPAAGTAADCDPVEREVPRDTVGPSAGLLVQAHNPEQEEAEEEVEVTYQGEEVGVGFNVNYLLDALAASTAMRSRSGSPTRTAAAWCARRVFEPATS